MLLLTGTLFPQGAAGRVRILPRGGREERGGESGEPQALAGLPKGWCLCAKGALVFVRSCPSQQDGQGGMLAPFVFSGMSCLWSGTCSSPSWGGGLEREGVGGPPHH